MESKPLVEARPPTLIESAVRLLVPPIAREHVLGDLAELDPSPGQYVLEAARTVPAVVASQIRRTSNFVFWPMVAMMLTSGFGAEAGTGGSLLRGAIPALATMIGFMFRDAYRVRDRQHPWRQGLVDVSVAAVCALASQAVVAVAHPDWLIAPVGVAGGSLVLAVLFLLRMQNPGGRVPRLAPPSDYSAMTIDQLRGDMASYDRNVRRTVLIEIVAASVMVPVFAGLALSASPPLVRIGAGLAVAGLSFVIWYIKNAFRSTVSIPSDAGFTATAGGYRIRLERHHDALRTIWLWYLLPLGIGPAVILGAGAMTSPRPAVAALSALTWFGVMWLSVAWINGRAASALRHRITAIERMEEQR